MGSRNAGRADSYKVSALSFLAIALDNGDTGGANMTIQVEISPEAEAKLAAAAGARGIPVETYAGSLLQEALVPFATGTGILSPGDVDALSKKLSEGSERLPILTLEANERASYYGDRG